MASGARLSRAELVAAYGRVPYRMPDPPVVERTQRQRVLDVVLPWRLARTVYGPYRSMRLSASGVAGTVGGQVFDPYVGPVVTEVVAEAVDPWVERLLTPRALLGMGLLLHLVRLVTGTWAKDDFLNAVLGEDSIVMLATGPISLVLGCVPLVALAYPGTRRLVARSVARPLLVGLLTVLVFAGMVESAHRSSVLAALAAIWFGPFYLCVIYLVHRNNFAVRAHPLARPLTAVPLVWLTVLGHVWLVDTEGTSTHGPALVGLLAGPVGVTATAVIEVVRLRRRHRVGFRGPLGHSAPPAGGR
ncbi:hypothetical protein [Kitasatospora sp. MMS16-BH015]|uniref:hypothetical protein n=1 Tax=Kitasatospora sp. MMS16-BH015 TaxID=2018025 RepID=UPI00131A4A5D|nr:hypothetical protein [Kitasatospora sp. MMS16-BH015]